jgi:hypothetical protein
MAPRVCSHCQKNLKPINDPGVKCAGPCNKFFHIGCGKILPKDIADIKAGTHLWQCKFCRKKRSSFIHDNQTDSDQELNVSSSQDFQSQINLLQATVESLKRTLNDLSKKYTELTTSVQFHSDESEEMKAKIISLESLHGKADFNDNQIKLMGKNIDECDEKIDVIDFNHHRNEVEISGIPEINSESLPDILNAIGQQLNLGEIRDKIINAERLGSSNDRNPRRNKPRSVCIKFWSVKFRDEFVSRGRSFMKRAEPSINRFEHSPSFRYKNSSFKCYFNDYLSIPKKTLLAQAKEYGKSAGINIFYTRCNQIYGKKNYNSTPVIIRKLDDLRSIPLN